MLAVTVREISMLVNLVLSATRIYLPLRGLGQHDRMYKAATSQAHGAGLAQSAIDNLEPFLIVSAVDVEVSLSRSCLS